MLSSPPRLGLIVNRRARSGADGFERACELLERAGLPPVTAVPLEDPAALAEAVEAALRAGVAALVVGGGDGTIAAAAARLSGRGVTLGVLPLGTANSFARSLGIPTRLEDAIDVIAAGHAIDADLGRAGEAWFANSAAIGLPGELADADLAELKRRFGRFGYLLGGLPRFLAHRAFRARIVADGTLHECEVQEIVIANGRYHGGVLVTWQAHLDSHRLVARVVKGTSKGALVRAWLRSASGRPKAHGEVELLSFREARIETDPPQVVAVDGEPIARTPLEVRVAAAALRVYAPSP